VSGAIKPQFVPTDQEMLLSLASSLIEIYNPKLEPNKAQIEEQVTTLVNSAQDITLAKGLNKILLDRSTFSTASTVDLVSIRADAFKRSFEFINQLKSTSSESVTTDDLINYINSQELKILTNSLYADLPEFEILTKIKRTYPKELLERYNLSLVQSLLLRASSLTLKIRENEVGKLRKLFKYLKFFQLLASIKVVEKTQKAFKSLEQKKTDTTLIITIDGPLSLFENTNKYGLRLASFFPAICDMAQWQLKTNLKIDGRDYKLNLDQTSELISHYRNFSSYVPEEVKIFHKIFTEKASDWQVGGATPFIRLKGQEILFPDLCFRHTNGKTIYLELFHRWHQWQLKQHLEFIAKRTDMIIGIDRALYKKAGINEIVSKELNKQPNKIFLFNNFPTYSTVTKALNSCL
jgi:predicted nuclease of restriction endonuclease-like RecB superfamily